MKTNNKSLKRNIALNVIKQLLSLIFPLITFPYVSQNLGADGYGIYNYVLSYVTYLSYFASMGINAYAVREGAKERNNKEKISQISSELFTINLFFTVISYVILIFLAFFTKKLTQYSFYLFILSLSIIFTTIGAEWINEIYEDYGYLTIRYIILHLISIVLIFLFVHNKTDLKNYCLITVFSAFGIAILNIFRRREFVRIKLIIKCNFYKHIKPMFVFFISSIAGVIYVNSDITIIGGMLSTYDAGIYSFSVKIYNMIKMTVATVVSTSVARLTFYYSQDENQYYDYLNKIFCFLSLVLFPIVVGTFVLKEDFIYFLGHEEYISGSMVLGILSIAIFFAILGSFYYSLVLIIRGNEKVLLIGTSFAAIVNIILNIILIPRIGIIAAAITTVIAELCSFLVAFLVSQKKYKVNNRLDKIPFLYSLIIVILIILCNYFIRNIIPGLKVIDCFFRIILLVVITMILYCVIVFVSKNKSIISFKESILRTVLRRL